MAAGDQDLQETDAAPSATLDGEEGVCRVLHRAAQAAKQALWRRLAEHACRPVADSTER